MYISGAHGAPNTSIKSGGREVILRGIIWCLFACLVVRYAISWSNAFLGSSFPEVGSIGLTAIFTAFSVSHAIFELGARRALTFLLICAAVSWGLESVGIATGLVYGPYHYGSQLGPKLGSVPIIIPFAWFMMIYPSWVISRGLLEGRGGRASLSTTAARIAIASMVMTAWDTVMDPGKALSGAWTWVGGGAYFGVPVHNFLGWLLTTALIYAGTELSFSGSRDFPRSRSDRLFGGLPVLAYALVATDAMILPSLPELRIVAMFGMGFIGLLAILHLVLPQAGDLAS
ncbi:MAG: carotenoid biosynthesis protein [Janthinobacterium lividum]